MECSFLVEPPCRSTLTTGGLALGGLTNRKSTRMLAIRIAFREISRWHVFQNHGPIHINGLNLIDITERTSTKNGR